ncbi:MULTISPECIES: hypothetical protein [unclassified Pseudonocardia]|uniref:hypothetical protein n=1 Tax=unclassified Pseudonocardia TaxID=2619320 RepID=UPI001CF6E3BC|nr:MULTISPECIES: hypothetical protein [unclassified Pseudonocardia]
MLRVSEETRERVRRVARDEFGGASADEVIRRLLDEHWERAVVAAVRRDRERAPQEWLDYLAEADELAAADAAVIDGWQPQR